MQEAIELVGASFILLAIFVGIASPIIVLVISIFYYLKKRLEHRQIMAAIEKGLVPSQLHITKPIGPAWIKNITSGIALLIITTGLVCLTLVFQTNYQEDYFVRFLIAIVLFALGISRLIRGLLQRNTYKAQIQSPRTERTTT